MKGIWDNLIYFKMGIYKSEHSLMLCFSNELGTCFSSVGVGKWDKLWNQIFSLVISSFYFTVLDFLGIHQSNLVQSWSHLSVLSWASLFLHFYFIFLSNKSFINFTFSFHHSYAHASQLGCESGLPVPNWYSLY